MGSEFTRKYFPVKKRRYNSGQLYRFKMHTTEGSWPILPKTIDKISKKSYTVYTEAADPHALLQLKVPHGGANMKQWYVGVDGGGTKSRRRDLHR